MSLKYFLFNFLIILFSFGFPFSYLSSLNFNILTKRVDNGGGKDVDIAIIVSELKRLGHSVKVFNMDQNKKIRKADVNIFLAQFHSKWFSIAKINWFIPNPEILNRDKSSRNNLNRFDLILCKTRETLRIFTSLGNAFYLGFTTIDKFRPGIEKKNKNFLHVAGKSPFKGTQEIVSVWSSSTQPMPELTLLKHGRRSKLSQIPQNIKLIEERISDESLIELQNSCGIHLCPSQAEGFGHCIMEAMSTEAVVITTNAPPMNEFIQDERCLVEYNKMEKRFLGRAFKVSKKKLDSVIAKLFDLSDEELRAIGKKNREKYLSIDREFKENFERLIRQTEISLTPSI